MTTAPDLIGERSASFVELFFDLVFVFGVTQVVVSIHGHLDWPTMWRAAVVLGLLWWAWSQFTWAAGAADFDELIPRVVLLAATAGIFVTAVSVNGAWGDDGATFGLGYFGVMALAGVFVWLRARGTETMAGMIAYMPRVLAGASLVAVGGFLEGDLRSALWIGGIVLNLLGAAQGGRYEWAIDSDHFTERHGLFVIIVLGEALIAIGVGTVGHPGTLAFFAAGTAALTLALAMWWAYFDWPYVVGRRVMKDMSGLERTRFARDGYTLAHYPLIAGVVVFAVGAEEILAHPDAVASAPHRWALAGGLAVYLLSMVIWMWRATTKLAWERLVLVAGLVGVAGTLGGLSGAWFAALVATMTVIALGVESARHLDALRELRARDSGSSG